MECYFPYAARAQKWGYDKRRTDSVWNLNVINSLALKNHYQKFPTAKPANPPEPTIVLLPVQHIRPCKELIQALSAIKNPSFCMIEGLIGKLAEICMLCSGSWYGNLGNTYNICDGCTFSFLTSHGELCPKLLHCFRLPLPLALLLPLRSIFLTCDAVDHFHPSSGPYSAITFTLHISGFKIRQVTSLCHVIYI